MTHHRTNWTLLLVALALALIVGAIANHFVFIK